MKLHLACGTVYLYGCENIDLELSHHFLAEDRPDLVQENITTMDKYYKDNVTKSDFMTGKYHMKKVVCDRFADVSDLPYEHGSIDEIIGMHILEHFTFEEGAQLLRHWRDLLKPGGSLRVHVPDIKGIIDLYNEEGEMDWCIRQLFGSQKNKYGLHRSGYTSQSLRAFFTMAGFNDIEDLDNINDYPAIGMRGWK